MSDRRKAGSTPRASAPVVGCPPPATLILGLGNPLRCDDGIGPRAVEELTRRGLPQGVAAVDGGIGGLDLLRTLEEWDRVVVVDAADVGREPGRFVRFTPDQVRMALASDGLSIHHAGLAEVLALADALDRPLPPIVIFGVQPEEIGWGEGLSSALEATLPALLEAILREVGEDDAKNTDH
jgi:hydrogenase maturation protease